MSGSNNKSNTESMAEEGINSEKKRLSDYYYHVPTHDPVVMNVNKMIRLLSFHRQ